MLYVFLVVIAPVLVKEFSGAIFFSMQLIYDSPFP
nr:MAG TPA: hypothetical protein [Caudoviricetes sp.]